MAAKFADMSKKPARVITFGATHSGTNSTYHRVRSINLHARYRHSALRSSAGSSSVTATRTYDPVPEVVEEEACEGGVVDT